MEQQIPAAVTFLHCTQQQFLRPESYALLLPLSGRILLTGSEDCPVETGSMLFLTPVCTAAVRAGAGTELLQAGIDPDFLESLAGLPACPPAVLLPDDSGQLADCMADLFDLQYNREQPSQLELHIAACRLLQALVTQISAEHFSPVRSGADGSRADQMRSWLEQHFRQPVQLQDLADAFGLSRQHCSAVFHEETGVSFSDCLLQLRLQEAQHLLLATDKSITEISGEAGFPNTSALHTAFQRSFQMTPKAWRQQNRVRSLSPTLSRQDILAVGRLLQARRMLYARQESTIHITEEIPVDHAVPIRPVWTDILNVDFSADCLHPAAQAQLAEIQQEMHFSYIRLNNVTVETLIEFFPGTDRHRFTNFIQLIEFFRSIGLTPMLVFGTRWLVTTDACIFTGGGYSTDPDSWLQMLRQLLTASVRQWGTAWVSTWRFEFSMPATQAPADGDAAFLDLFEASAKLIQSMLPAALVGGPALALDNTTMPRWQRWMQALRDRQIAVNFVSMEIWADCEFQKSYLPGQFGDPLEASSISRLSNADTGLVISKAQQIRELMQTYGLSEAALYISALGIARYQAMAAQIGGHCAAWLIKCSLDLQPLADGIGCWKALNTEAEYPDEYNFISSGCGLLERHGLRSPSWYAYRFLAALQPQMAFHGISTTVTTDGGERLALLLYNCKNYSGLFCRKFSEPQALDFLNPQLYTGYSATAEELTLTGLQPGQYRVCRYLIGDHHGCLARIIQQTGDINPTAPGIVEYLAGQSLPYQNAFRQTCSGTMTLQITLQPNEVMLITIEPVRPGSASGEPDPRI